MHGFVLPAAFGAGDVYNFYRIDQSHAGVFIVDVMGHGMAAASMAHLVSKLLVRTPRGHRCRSSRPLAPRETVARLNELFHGFGGGTFFTICYAVIDLETGEVALLRAGHPSPSCCARTAASGGDPHGWYAGWALSRAEVSSGFHNGAGRPALPLFRRAHRLHGPPVRPFARERLVLTLHQTGACRWRRRSPNLRRGRRLARQRVIRRRHHAGGNRHGHARLSARAGARAATWSRAPSRPACARRRAAPCRPGIPRPGRGFTHRSARSRCSPSTRRDPAVLRRSHPPPRARRRCPPSPGP